MFKFIFFYWFNVTDSPSIVAKVNIWSYLNIRLFKYKIQNYIFFFINSLNGFSLKNLKIFYKNLSFELFFFKSIYFLFFLFLLNFIFFLWVC